MNKIILLTSVVVFSMVLVSASRADVVSSGDNCAADDGVSSCHWELDSNGNLSITGTGAMKNFSEGWDADRPGGNNNTSIYTVTIGEGITHIGGWVFEDSSNITSINIPDSITSVGESPFANTSLTNIILPDSVTDVDEDAFRYGSEGINITCRGNATSCAALEAKLRNGMYTNHFSYTSDKASCENSGTGMYVWENNVCNRRSGDATTSVSESDCYNQGKVFYQDACVDEYPFAKKHWTPAEAAQYLKDTDKSL